MRTGFGYCIVACLLLAGCASHSRLTRDEVAAQLKQAGIEYKYLLLDKQDGTVYLDLHGHTISDLSPLRELPIRVLKLAHTGVADISPIGGMPIEVLFLDHTKVRDLSIVKSLPLKNLSVSHCRGVTTVVPLEGMDLQRLNIANTSVSDLSPLEGMTLRAFIFSPERMTEGLSIIRAMDSLESLGVMGVNEKGEDVIEQCSPEMFWRMFDAGSIFGRPLNK